MYVPVSIGDTYYKSAKECHLIGDTYYMYVDLPSVPRYIGKLIIRELLLHQHSKMDRDVRQVYALSDAFTC
jgi:hypothetical protein